MKSILIILTLSLISLSSYASLKCYDGWHEHCVLVKNPPLTKTFCKKHLGFNGNDSHFNVSACSSQCDVLVILSEHDEVLGERLVDKNDDNDGERIECPYSGLGWSYNN
ncbi:MAG: hypothetical protein KAQ98_05935 [Bacteriovoracaceae bacterium]|nr:hypothetical protein [Bacteriovoracaceae bacterium]